MKCSGGCGKVLHLNAFQKKAVEAGAFKSWTCADCAQKALNKKFTFKEPQK